MSFRPWLLFEGFAGTAAITRQVIGGPSLLSPVAYMGGKHGLAPTILGAVGMEPGQGVDSAMLCDGGPWGWAWQALEITCAKSGREWSARKLKREWLTMNRAPVRLPAEQRRLFASSSPPPSRSGKHDPRRTPGRPAHPPPRSPSPALAEVAAPSLPSPGLFPTLER